MEDFKKTLQAQLERGSRSKVRLKINDNRCTMVSVKWEPDYTKVSLHKMFLDAPRNIMEDLACYVRQEQDNISPLVKAFIEDRLSKLDYSHKLNASNLHTEGKVYNLKQIYNDLNREYFENKLKLNLTWFGSFEPQNKSRVTFGLYHDPLKLIKINRILDNYSIPEYLISYVMYHEMLHYLYPSYYDKKGVHRVHTKKFKEKEMKYKHFGQAQNWIKEHTEYLFI